jgi:hypothetical protein
MKHKRRAREADTKSLLAALAHHVDAHGLSAPTLCRSEEVRNLLAKTEQVLRDAQDDIS